MLQRSSQSVAPQLLVELAERSPTVIQNGSSNPSSRKNLDKRPYDRTTVRPYDRTTDHTRCYVVNCTTGTPTPRLCPVVQWSVHRAPSRTTRIAWLNFRIQTIFTKPQLTNVQKDISKHKEQEKKGKKPHWKQSVCKYLWAVSTKKGDINMVLIVNGK